MTINNERQFANKVRHVLNQGTRLDPATMERLRAARERALMAQKQPRARLVPAFAGPAGGEFGGWGEFALQVLLPVVLVLASAVALFGWQQGQQQADVEAIDAALLTDDLPIDALLDRGFEAWLKKRGAR